jgi:hypothetical protein
VACIIGQNEVLINWDCLKSEYKSKKKIILFHISDGIPDFQRVILVVKAGQAGLDFAVQAQIHIFASGYKR